MTERPVRSWNGLTIPQPGVYRLDDAHKRIGFLAQHMMISPVRGEFSRASATIVIGEDPLASTISASIQADSLDTNNADRDAHLISADFLDAAAHPTLEFRSTGVKWMGGDDSIFYWASLRNNRLGRLGRHTPPPATVRPSSRLVVTGDLTVRGATRPVELQADFGGASRDPYGRDIFGFSATAEIDRESYGLLWNVVLESGGVLVGKKVRIEIAGEAIHQPAA